MTRTSPCRLLAGALLAIAGPLLSSCELPEDSAAGREDSATDYERSAKLQTYDVALVGVDLPKLRQTYAALKLDFAAPSDSPFIEVAGLQTMLRGLEQAQGMAGRLPEIDAKAGRFIAALRTLVTRATALDSYFTMRGHLGDGYARARRDNAAMLAAYDAAIAALSPFQQATEVARAQSDALLLRRMRAEGRMGDYYDILLAQGARSLKLVTTSGHSNAQARGDRLVGNLTAMLERARNARAAEEARKPVDERGLDNGSLTNVELMIGAYREYRLDGEDRDRDRERVIQAADGVILAAQ